MRYSFVSMAVALGLLGLFGCGDDDATGIACPDIARGIPGIVVEIRDGTTGTPLAETASGAVHEGAFVDSLVPYAESSDEPPLLLARAAAHDRPGTYSVEVLHDGYSPWSTSGVRVLRPRCDVETVTLRADLEPSS